MTRPAIPPELAASLLAGLPSRLVKKLDAEPTTADRWTWTDTTVVTDKGETVSLAVTDGVVTAVACSCLLSPKCLHVGAVVTVLPVSDARPQAGAPAETVATSELGTATGVDEAARAFAILADVLATGAEATGARTQSSLLRSIHACRAVGLHRLAGAQTRILRSIRDLRADRPEFLLETLASDLRDALAVAHAVAGGDASPVLVGTARRDYQPAGNLRLRGVFTEAIVARSGFAGVVTYLIDERGTLYSRADVAAGDIGRAAGAYEAAAGLGDAVLPHRELGRAGLFVSDATSSADGRLGAGQKVRAVRATEPSRWDHPALDARWQVSLGDQLARIASHDGTPEELRPAGWDLVFVDGEMAGALLVTAGGPIEVTTAHDHRMLHARDNLDLLARAPGLRVRAIGRARLGAPRRLELLALGPAAGETRLVLPDAFHGRANLHYDRLAVPAGATGSPRHTAHVAGDSHADLLAALRRRVERVVLGGLGTLPTHALAEVDREAAGLAERALGGGGEALRDLAAVAHDATRAMTGARRAIDRPRFARAWLRAALYDTAARRRLAIASW